MIIAVLTTIIIITLMQNCLGLTLDAAEAGVYAAVREAMGSECELPAKV